MCNFWTIFLSSIGGAVVLSLGLVWLLREWISARLKGAIQSEYDVKLEGYKAGYSKFLAENEIRFSWWHEEKAKAIKKQCLLLGEMEIQLQILVSPLKPSFSKNQKNEENQYYLDQFANVNKARFKVDKNLIKNRVFFNKEDSDTINDITQTVNEGYYKYLYIKTSGDARVQDYIDATAIGEKVKNLIINLQSRFQDILQGKEADK